MEFFEQAVQEMQGNCIRSKTAVRARGYWWQTPSFLETLLLNRRAIAPPPTSPDPDASASMHNPTPDVPIEQDQIVVHRARRGYP